MNLELSGKSALIFGASKGLGRAIAAAMIAEGAKVAIVARDADRVARTATAIGALAITGDVSLPNGGRHLVEQAAQLLGCSPDILVTNSGGPATGSVETVTSEQWQGGFNSLWMSVIDSIRAALPEMRRRKWGRIIAITSVAAKQPQPGLIISNSLRAGVLGLVNSISRDVARDGITVNALLPGYINTDRIAELKLDETSVSAAIPAGRLGRPDEFAALAVFLASERASYINGQAIAVDGGLLGSI
jgi:3-oxoacyl-[acyl-carrier protein] reductase